jgi:Ca2+-binding RTX toxin-like protein
VVDGDGDKASADLTIHPDLTPPVAGDDHIVTLSAIFSVSNGQLLANDQQQDHVSVTAIGNADHLALTGLGWGALVALDGAATGGSFDYTLTAGNGKTDAARVAVDLVSNAGDSIDQSKSTTGEILIGDSHANLISGGSGDDVLVGGGGTDQLLGNGGNDRLIYDGSSSFEGGAGTDRLVFGDPVTLGFDGGFTGRVQSVEVLDFRNGGADTFGAGKGEALTIDAVLDMTGGKGELWIAAESGDSVTLDKDFIQGATVTQSATADVIPADVYTTYTATDGTHDVTVHIAASATTHT